MNHDLKTAGKNIHQDFSDKVDFWFFQGRSRGKILESVEKEFATLPKDLKQAAADHVGTDIENYPSRVITIRTMLNPRI